MADRLTSHPWRCFEQKFELTNEEQLGNIPQFHIVCTSTLATRDADLMNDARAANRLWTIDTGHDPRVTAPGQISGGTLANASDRSRSIWCSSMTDRLRTM